MKRYIITTLLIFASYLLIGQVVDTAYFKLEYTPKLIPSSKLNQKAEIKDTSSAKIKFNYYIVPQRVDVSFLPAPIKYNKVSPDNLEMMYRNFLKVGFGYPVTPLLDFGFHNLQNPKYSYGATVHHYSSWKTNIGKTMQQYPNAPMSDTRAHLHFNRLFKQQTLYTALNYNHEAATLYGFKLDSLTHYNRDSLKNNFHHLNAKIGIASNFVLEEKKPKQDVCLNYDLLRTDWKDMENHVGLNAFVAYDIRWMKISGSQHYRMNINFDYYNNQWASEVAKKSNIFLFQPELLAQFSIKEYHILVGLGGVLYSNNGTIDGTPCYPIAELQLGVIPSILSIYAGVKGSAEHNSLKDLLYENPFLKPHLDTLNITTNYITIYGGVKGNLVKKLNYSISAHYNYAKNMAFFRPDTLARLGNTYDVDYHDGNRLNVAFNLDYEILRNLRFNFDANYNLYILKDSVVALYKPMLEFGFNGEYLLKEKFAFNLHFGLGFGSKGLEYNQDNQKYETLTLKPILDFGLGFEYYINQRFTAFVDINNIACQHYMRYSNYPNMGINGIIGITYLFGNESIKRNKSSKKR